MKPTSRTHADLVVPHPSGCVATSIVFLVDDEPVLLGLTAMRLASHGLDIFFTTDGRRAVELARIVRPHLVITDLRMPGFDGLDVLHALRADDRTRSTLVVISSGESADEGSCLEAGTDGFLAKPFDALRVLQVADALLSKSTPGE